MTKILTLLIILCASSFSYAVPERDFTALYKTTILPFFEALDSGDMKNSEGLNLRYYKLKKASNKKALVILPGRTEAAKKYAEVFYDLQNKGFDLYILDHQGQGESDRILSDSQKGHVEKFQNYVKDVNQFVNEIVKAEGKELYLLSHSMGGAIAAHYLARHPDVFKKAVFMAPMFEINTKPYKETIARYYAHTLVLIGKGDEYAPGSVPWFKYPFASNPFTTSEARYEMESYLFTFYPELTLGGPTAKWVHESLKATKSVHKLNIKTPSLMFQAGHDEIVKPGRQNLFCKESFCRKVVYPESKHEILIEKDSIRNDAFKEIGSFLGF